MKCSIDRSKRKFIKLINLKKTNSFKILLTTLDTPMKHFILVKKL